MSNVTPISPSPSPFWKRGDYVFWNGTSWVMNPQCDDGCGCGPQPQPPSCFSAVAKADQCWDQSQALYNLVSKVVNDIFTKNPGIIPSPPPGTGSGPITGVTDGSNAAPGQVGEMLINTVNGTMTGTTTTVAAMTIPPGDWDIDTVIVLDLAAGGTFNEFAFEVVNAPQGFQGYSTLFALNMGGLPAAEGFQALTVPGAPIRVNCTTPQLLSITMIFNPSIPTSQPQTYIFSTRARRMR